MSRRLPPAPFGVASVAWQTYFARTRFCARSCDLPRPDKAEAEQNCTCNSDHRYLAGNLDAMLNNESSIHCRMFLRLHRAHDSDNEENRRNGNQGNSRNAKDRLESSCIFCGRRSHQLRRPRLAISPPGARRSELEGLTTRRLCIGAGRVSRHRRVRCLCAFRAVRTK